MATGGDDDWVSTTSDNGTIDVDGVRLILPTTTEQYGNSEEIQVGMMLLLLLFRAFSIFEVASAFNAHLNISRILSLSGLEKWPQLNCILTGWEHHSGCRFCKS